MKRIYTLLLLLCGVSCALQATMSGDWLLHPTYDSNTFKIVDTPARVYTLAYAQPYLPSESEYSSPLSFLFYYDKETDELVGHTKRTGLSDNIVAFAEYNPEKRYLLVVYDNCNIDLVYDNGEIRNIPGLMSASLPISKSVNDVTFWPEANQAWLATDFGYLCIDDNKAEIAESRNYSRPLESVARMGDRLFITYDGEMYESNVSQPNFNIADFEKVGSFKSPARLLPLDTEVIGVFSKLSDQYEVTVMSPKSDGSYDSKVVARTYRTYLTPNRDGYMISSGDNIQQLTRDGNNQVLSRYADDRNNCVGTWDFKEFWYVAERKGLYSRSYDDNGKTWTLTRGEMMPNAPAVFRCDEIEYHPRYGMLASNHGTNLNFTAATVDNPIVISGLNQGEWTKYGPAYQNPSQVNIIRNPNGLAIDPDNNDYVYFGSMLKGMARINLSDPEDILHMSNTSDATSSLPGFVAVVPDKETRKNVYKFTAPKFDADGNLWTAYQNHDSETPYELWCWLPEDRRATTGADNFRPWKVLPIKYNKDDYTSYDILLPLKAQVNRGLLLACGNGYDAPMMIIDTNGTPADQSDDRVVTMNTIYDRDGGLVNRHGVKCMYEDPSSGLVWVGTTTGLFTIQPRTAMTTPDRVDRIKVSRNDGTDLADYLLEGVELCDIIDDGQNRKWFATKGAGLVCTTSDGRTIIGEFTTDNSWLPDNIVYSVAYDPETRSILMSTMSGIAQYFPSGTGASGGDMESVRAYPNPVRPDYFGYVTIDGLGEDALVKICDAAGNLVKELGPAQGGEVKWDITNHSNVRVKTGVYFVLASSGAGDTNLANVTKVMVVN